MPASVRSTRVTARPASNEYQGQPFSVRGAGRSSSERSGVERDGVLQVRPRRPRLGLLVFGDEQGAIAHQGRVSTEPFGQVGVGRTGGATSRPDSGPEGASSIRRNDCSCKGGLLRSP